MVAVWGSWTLSSASSEGCGAVASVSMLATLASIVYVPAAYLIAQRLRARFARNDFGADGVGPNQPVGSMLLGGADGDDDPFRSLQIGLDFGPGRLVQLHGRAPHFPFGGRGHQSAAPRKRAMRVA